MKVKVCGMRDNILEISRLKPDLLGFIFWSGSSRFFQGKIPDLPGEILRVGVMVDIDHDDVVRHCWEYQLDLIQLHGRETIQYCKRLKSIIDLAFNEDPQQLKKPQIIKAFKVDEDFNFKDTEAFEPFCDYFLFDSKGKLPGGNGFRFDWSQLVNYTGNTPFFLSGGIGLPDLEDINAFLEVSAASNCVGIDINSRFESEPGKKDPEAVEKFIRAIRTSSEE